MPIDQPPRRAILACAVLGMLMVPLWIAQVSNLSDLTGSDAAGNGLSQVAAAGAIIALWALLAIVTFIAWINGDMPNWSAIAALILVPAYGFAAFAALQLLAHPDAPPYLWPLIVPAVVPPLVILFCFWALIPRLRAAVPAAFAAGFVWGVTLILCAAMIPMSSMSRAAP